MHLPTLLLLGPQLHKSENASKFVYEVELTSVLYSGWCSSGLQQPVHGYSSVKASWEFNFYSFT